jgi:hypothetical protein
VTVRQRIDQLTSEPAVANLGYSADQRLVATALLGLQLLADEIDEIKHGLARSSTADRSDEEDDVSEQLADLTALVKKMKKAVKKCAKNQKSKTNKKKTKK